MWVCLFLSSPKKRTPISGVGKLETVGWQVSPPLLLPYVREGDDCECVCLMHACMHTVTQSYAHTHTHTHACMHEYYVGANIHIYFVHSIRIIHTLHKICLYACIRARMHTFMCYSLFFDTSFRYFTHILCTHAVHTQLHTIQRAQYNMIQFKYQNKHTSSDANENHSTATYNFRWKSICKFQCNTMS